MITQLHYDGATIDLPDNHDTEELIRRIDASTSTQWLGIYDRDQQLHRIRITSATGIRITQVAEPTPPPAPRSAGLDRDQEPSIMNMDF